MEQVIKEVTASAVVKPLATIVAAPIVATPVLEVPDLANPVVVSDVVKTGWWASSSKMTKGLIIGGVIAAAAAAIWYFGFRKKEDDVTYEEVTANEEPSEENLAKMHSESVLREIERGNNIDRSSLPNGGVGCSEPRTSFNGDFDFVKCDGKWYIKSKQNPTDKSTLGKYPDWNPLQDGQVIVESLNSRFPN